MSITQHFPRRAVLTGIVAAGAILGAGAVWLVGSPGTAGAVSIGGPFTLTDESGKTVTDRDFRGKWLLVYFGYTYCPDVCPTTLNEVAEALTDLGAKADRVTPVFITIDPRRDTPKVVGQYAAAFSPRLVGLTGTAEQIAKVAREYRVYYAPHRTGPGPDDYTMDHSSLLYLMGPDGGFVAPIRADQAANELAADLSHYLG
jgi:cytochrome oxidase Cu insertion factor (SCO1/SenC/PrrC family)